MESDTINIEVFTEEVNSLSENIKVDGYIEIMGEKSHILALPEKYQVVENAENFLTLQKLYVYKGMENGSFIMLQMTLSESLENEWFSSINYRPDTFNKEDSHYGAEYYNDKIPKVQMAQNSFRYKGINYNLICITPDDGNYSAVSELMRFSNTLLDYLKEE